MTNIVLWLVFGALIGWLASIDMRTNALRRQRGSARPGAVKRKRHGEV